MNLGYYNFRFLLEGKAERRIAICRSGIGALAADNIIPDIHSVLCHDAYLAHRGIEPDEMSVPVLGG